MSKAIKLLEDMAENMTTVKTISVPYHISQIQEAISELEQLQAELDKHRWIPITESLPKRDGDYFVYTQGMEYEKTFHHTQSATWRDGKWDYIFIAGTITHWKPVFLPKKGLTNDNK